MVEGIKEADVAATVQRIMGRCVCLSVSFGSHAAVMIPLPRFRRPVVLTAASAAHVVVPSCPLGRILHTRVPSGTC